MLGAGFDDDGNGALHESAFELLDRLIDMSPTDSERAETERELRDGADGQHLAEMQAAFDAHPDAESAPDLRPAVMARLSTDPRAAAPESESGILRRMRSWLGFGAADSSTARAPVGLVAAAVGTLVVVALVLASGVMTTGAGVSGAAISDPAIDPRLIAVAIGAGVAFVLYLRLRDR